MDLEKIKELIKLVEKSNISGLSVDLKDFKVEIKKEITPVVSHPQLLAPLPAPAQNSLASGAPSTKDLDEGLLPITSPMVGTFYRAPSPDTASYVEIGDVVSPGKAVCIIEAMKLFNEIEAEVSGTVVKILAENGKPVEYGQTLMLVKPAGK